MFALKEKLRLEPKMEKLVKEVIRREIIEVEGLLSETTLSCGFSTLLYDFKGSRNHFMYIDFKAVDRASCNALLRTVTVRVPTVQAVAHIIFTDYYLNFTERQPFLGSKEERALNFFRSKCSVNNCFSVITSEQEVVQTGRDLRANRQGAR